LFCQDIRWIYGLFTKYGFIFWKVLCKDWKGMHWARR